MAACIGNQFDLQTLAIVLDKSQKSTALELHQLIAESLLLPLDDAYKGIGEWEIENGDQEDKETTKILPNHPLPITNYQSPISIEYKFAHDRIQQAAYSLIPERDKQTIHWQVGQLLLHNTPPQVREQKIFDIVNHLNFGIKLITVQSQRDELAQLNLMAGKKAKVSAAYEPAWNYLKIGLDCLSADSWLRQYDLTLALHIEAAEAAILSGSFEKMERLASVVVQQAKTLLDAYLIGLNTGDLEYAAYSACVYCYHSYVLGKELTTLEREMSMYSNALKQLNQETAFYYNQLNRQVVLNLMGRAEDRCRLIGESYDEVKMLPLHLEANTHNICHSLYFYKLVLCYLFQDY